jgi:glycerol kinase
LTVLAIDQGTSGTKAIVVDPVDGVLAVAEEPVHPEYLAGGGVEQSPEALLDSVHAAGRRALNQAGRPVEAVALANQGETVLAWDPSTGEPLSAAIGWQDRRSEALCATMDAAKDRVAERTGLVLDPYFSAPKMAWLRSEVTRHGVVTTTDAWLVHQLTGRMVTDVSTASRSLLTDLDSVSWDGELLDLFGLGDEMMPTIVACDEVIGTTRSFGGELTVAGLMVDQQAALLAEACTRAGTTKCTFGTGAFLLVNAGRIPVRSGHGLTCSAAWRIRDQTDYCLDGQVYAAASAVRWMIELGLLSSASELDQVAAEDAGGVLCVPALAGLAAPWWRPDASAAMAGMTLSTRRGQIVRAVLEGIGSQIAALTAVVAGELGRPLTALRVDGGLTRSATLMQVTADLTQLPVEVFPSPHATALGAAAMGRLALDHRLDVESAVAGWTPQHRYEPAWTAERARDHAGRWQALADREDP